MPATEYLKGQGSSATLTTVSDNGNPLPVANQQPLEAYEVYQDRITAASGFVIPPALLGYERWNNIRLVNNGAQPVTLTFYNAAGAPIAGSDYLPAAVAGVPGQWNSDFPFLNSTSTVAPANIFLTPASGNLDVTFWIW